MSKGRLRRAKGWPATSPCLYPKGPSNSRRKYANVHLPLGASNDKPRLGWGRWLRGRFQTLPIRNAQRPTDTTAALREPVSQGQRHSMRTLIGSMNSHGPTGSECSSIRPIVPVGRPSSAAADRHSGHWHSCIPEMCPVHSAPPAGAVHDTCLAWCPRGACPASALMGPNWLNQSRLREWTRWALAQADSLDPLLSGRGRDILADGKGPVRKQDGGDYPMVGTRVRKHTGRKG